MGNLLSHMNCKQRCLYDICCKHNLAYYLMFAGTWGFSCNSDLPLSKSLSFRLESNNEYLKDYQGLCTETIPFDRSNVTQILESIYCNSGKYDVTMNMDSYECHWHKGYGKVHIRHYVSIVSIDGAKELIICDDPYFNLGNQELPFVNFIKGCKKVQIHSKGGSINSIDSLSIIKRMTNNLNINQITNDISVFSEKLIFATSMYDLFDYMDDVFLCNNTRIIKSIADSRYCLSYLFERLSELPDANNDLRQIAGQFAMSSAGFEKFNNYYMKLFFNSSGLQTKLSRLQKKLHEIMMIESSIYENLIKMVKQ